MDESKKHLVESSTKNTEIISFFDKDASFVFAFKKTEKLASAIYLVTNLFPENEPLKWILRKKVSELLSFTLSYKDVGNSDVRNFVNNAQTRVLEIVSMLEVSMLGNLVSSMNFSVLKNEFSNLIEVYNAGLSTNKQSSQESIPTSFFSVPQPDTVSRQTDFPREANAGFSYKMSYNNVKDNTNVLPKDEFKRSNRQNIILGLVKKKKEVTIKDISLVIKDCSEKTIQRELISFISAGVLKRTGERRWSRYSLA